LRIALISDIHSNTDALKAVLADMGDYDKLLCLGDIVGYGAEPNEIIEAVHEIGPDLTICGNHDYASATGDVSGFSSHAARAALWTCRSLAPENRDYLKRLPLSAKLEADGLTFVAYHGSPREPLMEYIFPGMPEPFLVSLLDMAGGDVLLMGHTHLPMFYRLKWGSIANPGSVGQPRDHDPRASYAFVEIDGGKVTYTNRRVEYDIESAASKIRKAGLPSFLAERLYRGV